MEQAPKEMTKCGMVSATMNAKNRIRDIIEYAAKLQTDPRRTERLAKNECITCFYSGRIGGSAITERPCMCCGKHQMYGSTATDVLCLKCAQEHELCKHCGGDLHMRVRRKEWPEPKIGKE